LLKKILNFIFIDKKLAQDTAFLKNIALFNGLSLRALRKIALIMFERNYTEGEKIFEPGREANVVYIIKEGLVRISNENMEMVVKDGEVFETKALFDGIKHDCIACAVKKTKLYLIHKIRFNDMIKRDTKAGAQVMKNIIEEILSKNKRIEM
jgi:CRP-like cAMP-binding protein